MLAPAHGGNRRRLLAVALVALCGCGGHAPLPAGRLELRERLVRDPDDVRAYLALAELEEGAGRPSAALAALEEAQRRRSMLGPGLTDADRARLGRLLLLRGRARLARGAASAR